MKKYLFTKQISVFESMAMAACLGLITKDINFSYMLPAIVIFLISITVSSIIQVTNDY